MKEYQPGDIINDWKIIEWRCINPNTTSQTYKNSPKYALVECQRCKKTTRYILIYSIDKQLSQCCNSCRLIEKNTKNREVQIGKKYGKLTVIADAGYKNQGEKRRHYSIVQCDCGSKPFEVMDNKIQTGSVSSCGCLCSKGEHEIEQFLQQWDINYVKEYSFEDLISFNSNVKLRFDFGIIYNNKLIGLIEFDGRQHFYGPDTAYWGHTKDSLEDIQKRDNQKNNYCIQHNIPLLRIPYYALQRQNKNIEFYLKNFLQEVMPNANKR